MQNETAEPMQEESKTICTKPYYDAFDVCLICSHTRTDHKEIEDE